MAAELSILEGGAESTERPESDYAPGTILVARLIAPAEEGWRVEIGGVEQDADVDASVDPALVTEAHEEGSRVLVEPAVRPLIVGVLTTQRTLRIDRDGDVRHKVRSFEIDAEDEVVLKVAGAFVRAKSRAIEFYGERVVTRAQNLARILAAMIKLN